MDTASITPAVFHDALELGRDELLLGRRRPTVLLVGVDEATTRALDETLAGHGCDSLSADDAESALALAAEAVPDVVVSAIRIPGTGGLGLLKQLREAERTAGVPVVLLAQDGYREVAARAFELGADDFLLPDADMRELCARVVARIERPPTPRARVPVDPVTGAMTEPEFDRWLQQQAARVARGAAPGCLAYVALDELPGIEAEHGSRVKDAILMQLCELLEEDGRTTDLVAMSRDQVALFVPETPLSGALVRLTRLSRLLYEHEFVVGGRTLRLTPLIGYASGPKGVDPEQLKDRAFAALRHQAEQLDLHPTEWEPAMTPGAPGREGFVRRALRRVSGPLQVLTTYLICLGLPFAVYAAADLAGFDLTGWAYLAFACALAFTAAGLWAECWAAARATPTPPAPRGPWPRASAIIAAYLPNEADTVLETLEAFRKLDYPDLEIVLAYNTPEVLPVEADLHRLAARDPRIVPLKVIGSVSKAQNVNAALARVTGEFIGLFDADHHPARGSFKRAWRWLQHDADVVQGHCVVRNGDAGFMQKVVAVEFEAIYAVAHPGRARLHGFGIFGGSNGYWKASLLRAVRMQGFMLTEDIDSSLRLIEDGGRIRSDPGLVSRELAPESMKALWNQRMRWSQGWTQVSKRHLPRALRSRRLNLRQKLGVLQLLGWRELQPWLSLQVFPILAYWIFRGEPGIDWFVPVFLASTLFTLAVGPVQTYVAWRMSAPDLKERRRWFWLYLLASMAFYAEMKNAIARTAHLKESVKERNWKVTPRGRPPSR